MTIRENLARLRERIETAAAKAGRHADEITLIGVSKTHPSEAIREAYEAGLRHFGENRVQEWEAKRPRLDDLHGAAWQLVGHLQSNKAGKAARLFHSVDSVDDWELAQRLHRACEGKAAGETLRVLVEVHLGGEETKTGVAEEGLQELAEKILAFRRTRRMRSRYGHTLHVCARCGIDWRVVWDGSCRRCRWGCRMILRRPSPRERQKYA
jgi:PLP dependent protein